MQQSDFLKLFPNASPACVGRNVRGSGLAPKLEPNPRDGALGSGELQKRAGQKFLVRVTSVRKRLLDEDNLCEKYHVDLCRYAGAIPGDEAATTKIEVAQRKAEKGEEPHTIIEIYKLEP